ncbi:hypothetical protein MUN77_01430 [Leucobacter allii]|uniref:hypothetical protein n=1 Tax=Leucobacter allii TaxID=2932247 RepID=UPI001FD600BC|nr:hypothetical protein [Leucobacter allii]UOR02020.1 hypothetical protein MUN77_01430 [Leucobacter allii]
MARTMTDEEALKLAPAAREFITAVNDRDELVVKAALHHTDPALLAVLTAGWCGELENKLLAMREENLRVEQAAAKAHALHVQYRARADEWQTAARNQAATIARLKDKIKELGGRTH